MKTCSLEGCERPFIARERCMLHYQQLRRSSLEKKTRAERRIYPPDFTPHLRQLLRIFKITPERYAEMYKEQGGRCAVCKRPEAEFARKLSVDHDHNCCDIYPTCGKCTRGLLCSNCNRGVGLMKDSIENLERAIEYLKSYLPLLP